MTPHASSDEEEEVCELCDYQRKVKALRWLLGMYRDELLHALEKLAETKAELRKLRRKSDA